MAAVGVDDAKQTALDLSSLFLKTMLGARAESTKDSLSTTTASKLSTDDSDGSPLADSDSSSENRESLERCSDTCSVTSARPSWSPVAQSSLKARYFGEATQSHRPWVSGNDARKSAVQDCLPTESLEKLKCVDTELRYEQWPAVERRWQDSLCAEKKEEDRQQRPANGTMSLTETQGPMARCLPLKELEILRCRNPDLMYTNSAEIDSDWIATVCAEKKAEDALALQRSVELLHLSDLRSTSSFNRLDALDDRIQRCPVESRWSHDYYYSSQILQQ